jgi:hypothetical protein
VVGPASSTDGHLALFDGVTGKLLKEDSHTPADFASVSHTHAPSGSRYRQLVYTLTGTDFQFVILGDGTPVMALYPME